MNPTTVAQIEKKAVDRLFKVGLLIKGLGGLLELIAGIGALFLTTNGVLSMARSLVQGTLATDPDNPFANYVLNFAAGYRPVLTNLILFGYFVGHAVINLTLVTLLLKKKLWAYPVALAVFGALVAYELWQVWLSGSLSLFILTAFDLVVVALTFQEYEYVLARRKRSAAA